MGKKKKRLKNILIIVVICLVLVVIGEIIIGVREQKKSTSTEEQNSEILEEKKGTKQEELEVVEETPTKTEVGSVQKEDASYEKWLAAEMVIGVSLQYSEYEFTGIYLASETAINDSAESKGVYVTFNNGNVETAIYSQPLDEERTESGTRDLYTKEFGFATFDEISTKMNTDEYQKIEMDELTELISQLVLVSVYEH